jgi:hypothetical protein
MRLSNRLLASIFVTESLSLGGDRHIRLEGCTPLTYWWRDVGPHPRYDAVALDS